MTTGGFKTRNGTAEIDDGWCLGDEGSRLTQAGRGGAESPLEPFELAVQGTLPETEAETVKGELAVPAAPSFVPVFWQLGARADASIAVDDPGLAKVTTGLSRPRAEAAVAISGVLDAPAEEGFDSIDQAFFSDGDSLATARPSIDEFVDFADESLTLWQRFWRKW